MTLLSMQAQALKPVIHKLASLQSRAWLPPTLLLLALSSVFIFGGDRDYFYKNETHNFTSAKTLAIADNLSPDHRFLMFIRQTLDEDGELRYRLYNRFPIGGYALIKLAILPFGDDLSAKIYAARTLTLLCFAAAILAYLSLRRITASAWIALTATLTAFSSIYCLYYSDLISNEVMIDLFALMLVFHGMALFEQDGRFRQLLLKSCIALLLGWHSYALATAVHRLRANARLYQGALSRFCCIRRIASTKASSALFAAQPLSGARRGDAAHRRFNSDS